MRTQLNSKTNGTSDPAELPLHNSQHLRTRYSGPSLRGLLTTAASLTLLPKAGFAQDTKVVNADSFSLDASVALNTSLLQKRATSGQLQANNRNLPGYSNQGAGGFGLLGGMAALNNYHANPTGPGADSLMCNFVYKPFLSGSISSDVRPFFPGSPYQVEDIQQGGIGDCGFGAALAALRSNLQLPTLARRLIQVNFDPNAPIYMASFFATSERVNVLIDDKLPAPDQTNTACAGYRMLASYNAPRNNFYIALLEKAWAKYVDAYPQFRSASAKVGETNGYAGLEGTRGNAVLRAITGLKRVTIPKKKPDKDVAFLKGMLKCINGPQACVVATPDTRNLDKTFGKASRYGVHVLSSGMVFSNNEYSFTVIDYDQGNKPITLVTNHWYGLLRGKTKKISGTFGYSQPNTALITLRNPWGCSPGPNTGGYCADGDTGDVVISLRALITAFNLIETIEP